VTRAGQRKAWGHPWHWGGTLGAPHAWKKKKKFKNRTEKKNAVGQFGMAGFSLRDRELQAKNKFRPGKP